MATVPGVFYIGGFQIMGGQPGLDAQVDSVDATNLRFSMNRNVERIVPDNPADGSPTAAALGCYPWYDRGNGATNYTITASSTTSVTVAGTPFVADALIGRIISVRNLTPLAGVGFFVRKAITANTTNSISFSATTAPPVGASFQVGVGRFVDYHAAAGFLHISEIGQPSTRGGSTVDVLGAGVGPDATLVRRILEDIYPASPYFHMWKQGDGRSMWDHYGDSPNDSGRAIVLAEKVRVDAAATERGNTIAWKHAIIDFASEDLLADVSTPTNILQYEPSLRQFIAWLRSSSGLNASDLKITLVSHHPDFLGTSFPTGMSILRAVHKAIAGDTDGVAIADCFDFEKGTPTGSISAWNAEITSYPQAEYFRMGDVIADAMVRLETGTAAPNTGGYPVYMLIGDSIAVGTAIADWTLNSNSELISGPTVGSLVRPSNQKIWNPDSGLLEVFIPHTNSNVNGTISSLAGPDLSIMAQLGLLHPDGFALVKRGGSGSSLAALPAAYNPTTGAGGRWIQGASEHWNALEDAFDGCVQYINDTLGKQADLRGIMVILGTNDASIAGGGALFEANLGTFCNDLWDRFPTRTSGKKAPIIWRRPQTDASSAIPAEVAQILAALNSQERLESQFRSVDVSDLERDRGDNLHETPDSGVIDGQRLVATLQKVAI